MKKQTLVTWLAILSGTGFLSNFTSFPNLTIQARAQGPAPPPQASTCVACHGPQGISLNEIWPNIAGQKRAYLQAQLEAYHNGSRYNPLMTPISKMLTAQDITILAEYFSQLKPTP